MTQRTLHIVLGSLFASAVLQGLCAQPMSGRYTLDPAGSGPRNFTSFVEANHNLTRLGVDAPVIIEVANQKYTSTHTSWVVSPIPGASQTNRVTFRAKTRHKAVLEDIRAVVGGFFATVRWVTLDGFVFSRAGNYRMTSLSVANNVEDIEILNCHFAGVQLRLGTSLRVHLHHCLFDNTAPLSRTLNLIDIENAQLLDMHHNEIRLAQQAAAIKIYDYTSLRGGARIYNNLIWGSQDSGESAVQFYAHSAQFDHNTIALFKNSRPIFELRSRPGLWNDYRNNIFFSLSTTDFFYFPDDFRFTHFFRRNIYWHPNARNFALYRLSTGSTVTYPNLLAWQLARGQDPTGIEANPRFKSTTDLRPAAGSRAAANAVNTPAHVTTDFEGDLRPTPATIGCYESSASFAVFGTGCAGTANLVPDLSSTGSLKHGSMTFAVTLSNALSRPATQGFLAIGGSNTNWGTLPLPLPLGGGCSVLVAPDIILGQSLNSGTGSVSIQIPSQVSLRGAQAFFQWGVIDPAAGGIGVAMSNGGTLTL